MLEVCPLPSASLDSLIKVAPENKQRRRKKTWLNTPLIEIENDLSDLVRELLDGYDYLGWCMKHGKKQTWQEEQEIRKKFVVFSCSDSLLCPVEGVRIRKREVKDFQVGETGLLSYEKLKSFAERWDIELPEAETKFRVLKPSLWSLLDRLPTSKVYVYDEQKKIRFYSEKVRALAIEFTLPKRLSLALQERALEDTEGYWKIINKLFDATRKVEKKIIGEVQTGGLEVLHLGSSEWAFEPHIHFHNVCFVLGSSSLAVNPEDLKLWREEWKKEALKVFKKCEMPVSSEDEKKDWDIKVTWLNAEGVKRKICYELRPWAWDAEKVLTRSGFVFKDGSLVLKGRKGKKKEIAIADIKKIIKFIEMHRGKDLIRWSGRLSNSTRFKLFVDMGLKPKIESIGDNKMKCVKVENFKVEKRDFKNKKITLKYDDGSIEEVSFKDIVVISEKEYSEPPIRDGDQVDWQEVSKRSPHVNYSPPKPRREK